MGIVQLFSHDLHKQNEAKRNTLRIKSYSR